MPRPSPSLRSSVLLASLLALGVAASLGGTCDNRRSLRIGTCQRDITPVSPGLVSAYEARFGIPAVVNHTDPVFLSGFGNDRQATDYHDRLWARGIVLESREKRVAIVALDLVGYFFNEVETIRAMIAPASDIDYAIVHSTHQHQGPDTMGLWGPTAFESGIDFAYLDFVNAVVADCIDEAATNLQPGRVKYATADSSGLSLGLDAEDDGFGVGDGKVLAGDDQIAPATGGRIVDPRIALMQFTSLGPPTTVRATLVNFASHPESLGSNNTSVTSDFPHFVRERIEAEFGGLAIWVSGALGVLQGPLDIDVLDPQTSQPAQRRTFRFAEVHGTQLAERAIAAFDSMPGSPTPRISFATQNPLAIPLESPFFRAFGAIDLLNPRRSLYTDGEVDDSVGLVGGFLFALGEDIHTEVGALRIGEGSFAIVPGELDPQIGETYRAHMLGAEHSFIIGLGNDEIGYQVPADKWDNSCHACFGFVLFGNEDMCPIQPIDCSTVFINNVGQMVDPTVSAALIPLIDSLH